MELKKSLFGICDFAPELRILPRKVMPDGSARPRTRAKLPATAAPISTLLLRVRHTGAG